MCACLLTCYAGPFGLRSLTVQRNTKDLGDKQSLCGFKLEASLGRGHFGVVRRGVCRQTGSQRAIKCISKSHSEFTKESLASEIGIMESLDHPHVLRLHSHLETATSAYLVLDLCRGGDLVDAANKSDGLSEPDILVVAAQLLTAVAYLHSSGVAHRDIKGENCLLWRKGPVQGNVLKLCDFGFAARFDPSDPLPFSGLVGTGGYTAPEVLQGRYGPKCDVWSCAVTIYATLSLEMPYGEDARREARALRAGKAWSFDSECWDSVSRGGKAFLVSLSQSDADRRPTAAEALEDHWLARMLGKA